MFSHILVPVDGSPAANQGLSQAAGLARALGATVRLFHVIDLHLIYMDPTGMTGLSGMSGLKEYEVKLREVGRDILQAARLAIESPDLRVEVCATECYTPNVADKIIAEARSWPADLIVMGTHGRRGLRGLVMGSDAESVLHASPVPMLLVRGDGTTQA
ncbi:universal stress protein [Jeongeupia chitinilytica]|uniref:Universal stress protein n=1 Tax=Jeongeupia chitinilytica TaxID=1041641 RepID=A0ABQ3H177_9NEIS|nr:universal stress protein [Jeongeupia chitinilytica]GHD62845.1 universal stress protein [Jeongeupia chitinilytica]